MGGAEGTPSICSFTVRYSRNKDFHRWIEKQNRYIQDRGADPGTEGRPVELHLDGSPGNNQYIENTEENMRGTGGPGDTPDEVAIRGPKGEG